MFAFGNLLLSVADAGDGEFWLGSERGLWRTRQERPPVQIHLSDMHHGVSTVWSLWRDTSGGTVGTGLWSWSRLFAPRLEANGGRAIRVMVVKVLLQCCPGGVFRWTLAIESYWRVDASEYQHR